MTLFYRIQGEHNWPRVPAGTYTVNPMTGVMGGSSYASSSWDRDGSADGLWWTVPEYEFAQGGKNSRIRVSPSGGIDSRGISLFAIDPGETTGWSWCCLGRNEIGRANGQSGTVQSSLISAVRSGRFMCGQIETKYGSGQHPFLCESSHAHQLLRVAIECQDNGNDASSGSVPKLSHVIAEDFILRESTKGRSLLSPVRLTSMMVDQLHSSHEIHASFHLQQPADAKSVTDSQLREHCVYAVGNQHARDATRHLILFLRKMYESIH